MNLFAALRAAAGAIYLERSIVTRGYIVKQVCVESPSAETFLPERRGDLLNRDGSLT